MADRRARLTILGGYLGSGKTTWLRHRLHQSPDAPHVIVNEAAETPVDDLLLRGAGGLTLLCGGCACCDGRADLIAALRQVCDARSRGAGTSDIWLETSGLADPGAITAAIRDDPVLVHHLLIAETLVAVDALHGLAQLVADPLGRRQVQAADRLILTKADAADPGQTAILMATLRSLNPAAVLEGASHGSPFVLPERRAEPLPLPDAPACAIRAETLMLDSPVDWPALSLWLSALLHARGDDLVRVKGVIRTSAGRLLLQAVRRTVQRPEILPDAPAETDDRLVFLGQGATADQLDRSYRACAGLPPPVARATAGATGEPS